MDINQIKRRYGIVGNNQQLLLALSKAVQVAPTDLSILVTGESGVGKDVFARIVHDNSTCRKAQQGKGVVSVNCGAIPEGTIESELFGHVKGSFTGADKDRKGYFEEADGGTIFLDEVGELPLSMQVKLLRVLENGEIMPVGSSIARKVDVRVVAATNVDIMAAIRAGRFREDLYYRLNQIAIHIPALRERRDDIPLLFRKFSSDMAERFGMQPIFLDEGATEFLCSYPWYGNIRELKNVTEQISVLERERNITRSVLEGYLSQVSSQTLPAVVGSYAVDQISDRELLLKALSMGQMINEMRAEINELRNIVTQLASGGVLTHATTLPIQPIQHSQGASLMPGSDMRFIAPSENPSYVESTPLQEPVLVDEDSLALDDRERQAIEIALSRHRGNRKLAANDLHISERTLYRKIKEYNITD